MLLPLLLAAVIDAGVYPDDAAARAAWTASEKGCASAEVAEVDGRKTLALRCNFAGTQIGRGSWDRSVAVPMGQAQGVEFEIRCDDTRPISAFSLYLHSGDGWYHGTFSPRYATGWSKVLVERAQMKEDGKPGSWQGIDKIRLSAWRGGDTDTTLFVRNIHPVGMLGVDARVLILQGADREGEKNVASYADRVSRWLGADEIRHAMIKDEEATDADLKQAPVVVLPYNPKLPPAVVAKLRTYLDNGGRLLAFYALPRELAKVTDIDSGSWQAQSRPGQLAAIHSTGLDGAPAAVQQRSWALTAAKPANDKARVLATWFDDTGKDTALPAIVASYNAVFVTHVPLDEDREGHRRLLLAMLGRLDAKVWEQAVAARLEHMGEIGTARSVAEVMAELRKSNSKEVQAKVKLAADLGQRINSAFDSGHAAEALEACGKVRDTLLEAYCLAQPSKAGEFRAMWCHSAFGVNGESWEKAVARLKDCGFTAVMPNMLWGGTAYYPSDVLPVSPEVAKKGDQIAECLAACKKHGIQMHVWKVNWNLGHEPSPAFVEKLRAEKRLQQSWNGEEHLWLCPSNPLNEKLEHDAMLEVATKYDIDGIHFDYIRYPGADHCFCTPCRERFEKASGKAVANWPKDVQMKGPRRAEWEDWCQNNITTLVRHVSEDVHKLKPRMKVSAAVFRNWDIDRHWVMQDWKQWCERGYLDFVCPMDYTENDGTYEGWMKRQKELAGPAGLVPGIGASSSNYSLTPDRVINQINLTRKYGTQGFIIFNYGEKEAANLLPMLKLGATKP